MPNQRAQALGSDRLRRCSSRLDQLNEISFFGGRLHKERCVHLRQTLLWLNRGQGIGFCVFGVVIDRILLKRFFSALAGSSVTIVTGLATLGIARSGDNSPEGGEAAPNCSSCPACP